MLLTLVTFGHPCPKWVIKPNPSWFSQDRKSFLMKLSWYPSETWFGADFLVRELISAKTQLAGTLFGYLSGGPFGQGLRQNVSPQLSFVRNKFWTEKMSVKSIFWGVPKKFHPAWFHQKEYLCEAYVMLPVLDSVWVICVSCKKCEHKLKHGPQTVWFPLGLQTADLIQHFMWLVHYKSLRKFIWLTFSQLVSDKIELFGTIFWEPLWKSI